MHYLSDIILLIIYNDTYYYILINEIIVDMYVCVI